MIATNWSNVAGRDKKGEKIKKSQWLMITAQSVLTEVWITSYYMSLSHLYESYTMGSTAKCEIYKDMRKCFSF